MAPALHSARLVARTRLVIALAACASPVLVPAAANADPEVPAGAICDAVAPSLGGASQGQDGDANENSPAQALAKAQQIQKLMNRIQQNGGLTSGASGESITTIMQAVPSGDLPTAIGAGNDLANTLRPQLGLDSPEGLRKAVRGEDEDSDEAPPQPAPQGKPLIDDTTIATAQKTMQQNCEILKANQNKPADDSPADDSPDDSN